ncbi:MAG TPA: tRNA lysidine(34) synthetase TilS [Luteimonas sp.]|nr:tRNA lysidine(34) synthetase TilS [Luteimonas sp.]
MPGVEDRVRGVLVGLSGGLDSVALLHLLSTQPRIRGAGLRALHVHHGLQPAADDWAAHCRAVCEALDVPLQVVRVDVARDTGSGLEAAARSARRAAFADALREGEVLALAHHRDDQAETFLLRALRASGPDGLAAMRPWQRFGSGWLWRPLLAVPRAGLLAHARAHGLPWIEDPSNDDTAHDRNFLRHRVLPLLRERWPAADAALARSAALAAEAGDLLADEDASALDAARTPDPYTLSVTALAALPRARRARVLRRWVDALGLPPLPAQGVARIECDLLAAAADAGAMFEWQGCTVRRWRGLLHAGALPDPLPSTWRVAWDGRTPLALPGGGSLRLEGADGFETPLFAHARGGGERIRLPGRAHSHALKHVLQDLGVPPWRRGRLPLLSDADGRVQAAGDLVASATFDAWLRARGARLAWRDAAPGAIPPA